LGLVLGDTLLIGKLVLFSRDAELVRGKQTLRRNRVVVYGAVLMVLEGQSQTCQVSNSSITRSYSKYCAHACRGRFCGARRTRSIAGSIIQLPHRGSLAFSRAPLRTCGNQVHRHGAPRPMPTLTRRRTRSATSTRAFERVFKSNPNEYARQLRALTSAIQRRLPGTPTKGARAQAHSP
jgi:hypothetical protein